MKTNIKSSISYFENNFFNIIPIDDVMNIKKETEETSFITDDDEKLPQLINIYNELKEKYLSLNIDITRKLFRKIILDNGQNNLTFVSIVRGGMPILYCFDKWCKKENIRAQFINMSLRGDIKYINNILSKIKNRSAGKIIFLDGCVSTGNTFWYLKKFLDLNKLNYSYYVLSSLIDIPEINSVTFEDIPLIWSFNKTRQTGISKIFDLEGVPTAYSFSRNNDSISDFYCNVDKELEKNSNLDIKFNEQNVNLKRNLTPSPNIYYGVNETIHRLIGGRCKKLMLNTSNNKYHAILKKLAKIYDIPVKYEELYSANISCAITRK